jgi:hypothetical protein
MAWSSLPDRLKAKVPIFAGPFTQNQHEAPGIA